MYVYAAICIHIIILYNLVNYHAQTFQRYYAYIIHIHIHINIGISIKYMRAMDTIV